MNGIIFCVCSTLAISVLPIGLEVMSKRTQEDAGEERVTAKSKPTMILVSRYSVKDPNVLASIASESPGKTKSECQNVPLSSLNVQQTSTGRLVLGASSSNYSEWKTSGLLKSGNLVKCREQERPRPVDDKFVIDDDMDSNTATESNISLRSRSFLNRVNDRFRKTLDHSSRRCNARHRQTFYVLVNVYVFDFGSISIHGKEILRQFTFHQKYRRRSHFKTDVRHIWKDDSGTIRWDFWSVSNQLGKFSMETINYLWSMMKKSSVSRTRRFMYSQILCYASERWTRTLNQIMHGKNSWVGSKIHHNTKVWTQMMVSEWNSSGIFSHDSIHSSSSTKSKSSWTKWATQRNSKDESSSCRCSMTSDGELKTMNRNVLLMPHLCLYLQKDFQQDVGHSAGWIRKEVVSTYNERPQGEWDRVAELMMIKFRESGHPVFRATSPLSRGTLKSKGGGKLSIHFCADGDTIETVFRTIISVNQLSIYGAVSDVCEEYSTSQTRTERPVLARQSDPLFAPANLLIMTPRPSLETLALENLLQKYKERIQKLPQQDRVLQVLTTVEVGQYCMTKHTEEFSQFTDSVACRECTLPRDEKSSDPKSLDSREHRNWTRVGSHNQLFAR